MNPNSEEDHEVETYGDPGIVSLNAKVPRFLTLTYLLLPIWGIVTLAIFWNGSLGWFDRGYWHELQIAANTTFPIQNQNMVEEAPKQDKKNRETTSVNP